MTGRSFLRNEPKTGDAGDILLCPLCEAVLFAITTVIDLRSDRIWLVIAFASLTSCAGLGLSKKFQVVPGTPSYLLRSPDRSETPLPEVLRNYNDFVPGQGSINLRSPMELRIENAYYEKGASRRGLKGYLGTEVARYRTSSQGLDLVSVQSMKDRPPDDQPVQKLIAPSQTTYHYHKLYLEILFRQNNNERGSVLLGANSTEEIDRLSDQLTEPESVCNATSTHCTVFPEACSVSVEILIVVNNKSEAVVWTSTLSSVADHPRHLEIKRFYAGRLTPIKINPRDPDVLRLPLLPGDHINWD